MFIRRYHNKRKDGSKVQGHILLEGHRIGGKVKQRTLLNLGPDFSVPKEHWAAVTREVKNHLLQSPTIDGDAFPYREVAENIAKRLEKNGYKVGQKPVNYLKVEGDFEHQVRTVGGERLCLRMLKDLGFMEVLGGLGFKPRAVKICAALVTARMLHPASERSTHYWMTHHSAIWELLGLHHRPPAESTLHRHADRLIEHKEAIMDGLYKGAKTHLGFSETISFYDLTNTYYTGKQKGKKLKRGYSKEKRFDRPLMSLALVLDACGFPKSVDFLPGNISEPGTLKAAVRKLDAAAPSIIMDAGIATQENLDWLRGENLDYICVHRGKTPEAPDRDADQTIHTKAGQLARLWTLDESDDELRLYVFSEARKAVADQILETKRLKFEDDLTRLHNGLTRPYCTKRYEKVLERIGRYKERYSRVAGQYDITITKDPDGPNAISVTFVRKETFDQADRAAGGYVLRTSHTKWSLERIVRTYWQLTDIEATFRTLKSDLGLRPIYHSKDERIEAHLFVSVLAYHAVHLMRTKLKKHQIHDNWGTLQDELRHWHRVTTTFQDRRGHTLINRQDAKLTDKQREMARHLGVSTGRNLERTLVSPAENASDQTTRKAA